MFCGITCQIVEEIGDIRAHGFVTGENSNVFINTRGDGIVIPSGKMKITANAVPFLPYHHGDLTMCLEAYQAIYHVYTCLLEHLRPADIAFFIEARLKFHQ